ncbi:hypothetical protein Tco_1052534, partial [Tanacetum coccineum]
MSLKDNEEESCESDSDDENTNVAGSLTEHSKKKKLRKFDYFNESEEHVHLTEEQINAQKNIIFRFLVSDFQPRFIMDDPNITMDEYIRLEEENAQRHGRTFKWQTATYGKMEYYEGEDNSLTNFKTEYPAIVFDDTSDASLSCEPTVSPFNENEIDFRISFDEFDDEDYMVIFDENLFSYKIISVDNLKMDSENEIDKVNMPSSPGPTISHSDDLDFFKDFENEFPAITYNDDLTSELTEPS